MLAQVPVLAMDVSSVKEIIGDYGLTVPFGDVNLFSQLIVKLINRDIPIPMSPGHLQKYSPSKNLRDHLFIYSLLFGQ